MAQRLAAIADGANPMDNSFMNRARLELLSGQALPSDVADRARLGFRLAVERLHAGDSEEAVADFEELLDLADQNPEILGPVFQRSVRSHLAMAQLRRGEQLNCVQHHGAASCLFPIQDAGRHEIEEPSREAMGHLVQLLEDDPGDLTSRWLLNLAAMTVGEYPDGVPEVWRIPPQVFDASAEFLPFQDVAPTIGLATSGLAGGSLLEDLDGDGDLDVMASSWGLSDPLHFFQNRRGVFEEVTEVGLDGITGGLNLVHGDYDNDGDVDVFVLRGAWLGPAGAHPNSLLENRGDDVSEGWHFADVTEEVGLLSFHPTQTAAWGDFDNDGWLDLFVGNESLPGLSHPCELYRNQGPGEDGRVTFVNVAREAGVAAGGFVKGVAWGDYDNDGWLDLYVSRLLGRNLLYRNRGASGEASFEEVGRQAGVDQPAQSFPTWFFDFDNDGWLDLFTSGYMKSYVEGRAADVAADYLGQPIQMERPRLYRNRGPDAEGQVTFEEVTEAMGLDRALLAMGSNFGDVDNDGFLDLYLGTGAPDFRALVPNLLFRNDGGQSFRDVTFAASVGHLQKGHGVSFGDVDNDGDQDIFHVLGGAYSGDVYPNTLFLNPGHGQAWVTLRLEGASSNRSAIGARLRLELETPSGTRAVHRVVGTGGSFGASSLQQEIGLGQATRIRMLEILWPGGEAERFQNLAPNRILAIRQGSGKVREVESEGWSLGTMGKP